MRCANDPQRRERVVQATLGAVITHGIHGVIHRKVAVITKVPLGSMTHCFSEVDELLMKAFGRFIDRMMLQYQDFFADIKGASQTHHVITDMIHGSQVTTPDNMELMYQLYTSASRKPALKTVIQNWTLRSQQTLEQWFDPVAARALDALIEGVTLCLVTGRRPLQREDILLMTGRIAGVPATVNYV